MRRWLPQPSLYRWVGLIVLLIAAFASTYVGLGLSRQLAGPPETWPVDLRLYGNVVLFLALLLLTGALLYRVAAAFTLSYDLDRNGLYINWLGNRAVVPLDQIQSIDIGLPRDGRPLSPISGIGYFSGQRRLADGKITHLFASRPPARCLAIYTADGVYAVSPKDTDTFVQELEQRRNLGATKPLAPTVEPSRIFLYAFWNDNTVRALLLVAFALNLALLALLAARYPYLAPMVEMRFNAAGQVTELQPRHEVIFMPLAAFVLTLLNTGLGLLLYRNYQLGARLLQGASVVAQVLFGIALFTIVR